jgi:hypothetical protein
MSMMTDDGVFEASAGLQVDGQRSEGKQAVRAAYAAVFEAFHDAHLGEHQAFHRGQSWCVGMDVHRLAKGRQTRGVTGCDLFTFRDGKIAIKNSYRKNRPAM